MLDQLHTALMIDFVSLKRTINKFFQVFFFLGLYLIVSSTHENNIRFEFSLNVFTEFAEFGDNKYHILKRLFEPATSCVRDHDATTAPVRHR